MVLPSIVSANPQPQPMPFPSRQTSGEELDQAMGFSHDKTTHHFRLYADGGAIEVTANDPKDDENIQAIRSHLKHITAMFSEGDFSTPMFVHDQVPLGVSVMKEKRTQISYSFVELSAGGKVQFRAAD